jgi:lipoate-protein ligase A
MSGRHQNPWKECHIQQMNTDDVLLARRKSGGGAVYQDLGKTTLSSLIYDRQLMFFISHSCAQGRTTS